MVIYSFKFKPHAAILPVVTQRDLSRLVAFDYRVAPGAGADLRYD